MPEQVNIASLTIDVDDVIKNSIKLKAQLDGLKQEQKELAKSGQASSEAFIQNDISIRKLSKSYKDSQQLATALESANSGLEKTISSQNKSTQELYDSRSELQKISKNIIGDTEEEIELREKLNNAIDDQTEQIRSQGSTFNAAKDRIGEYKDNILEAVVELKKQEQVLKDTKKLLEENIDLVEEGSEEYENMSAALVVVDKDLKKVNDQLEENSEAVDLNNVSLTEFVELSADGGGASAVLAGGLKKATKAAFGLIKAMIKFIATPVGALLAVLVGAFLLIKNAMDRNEEAANKLKKGFAAFSGIIRTLFKILEPLGEFLIDVLVKSMELAERAINKALAGIKKGLEFVGADEAAEKFGNFSDKIKDGSKAAKELAEAQAELTKAQRIQQKTQLDFQRTAEKLRQLRDDETKNIKDRKGFNEALGVVLKKQLNSELLLANKALKVANLRIKLEGDTTEALDARAEALTEISDINERIEGQESEQLVNLNSLNREAAAIAKEAAAKQKELSDKKKADDKEAAEAKIEEAEKAAEKAVELAKYELNEYIRLNKSKLDSDKFLTAQSVEEEKRRLDLIAEEQRKFAALELEKGQISQLEYNARINEINDTNFEAQKEVDLARSEAEKEQAAIDFENKLAIQELQHQEEATIQTERLEAQRLAEVEAAKTTGADLALINEKFALQQKEIDDTLKAQKLSSAEETFGGVAKLLGEQTKAGKAAGIAQATINTYQGVTEVLKAPSVLPEPAATIAKIANTGVVLGTGLKTVAKISGVKLASGGRISGAGSGKSDSIPAMLSNGESVINANSTSKFAPLLSAINVAGGGSAFASGGIAGATSTPSSVLFDYNQLAAKVAEANSKIPAPVVSVTEINKVAKEVQAVENLATS